MLSVFLVSSIFFSSFQLKADFLDKKIQSILQEPVTFSGPNCHNTSLRALGLMEYRRYVHEPEVNTFLDKNCKSVQAQSGALGVVTLNNINKPFHSFIRLENETVFTKNGFSKSYKKNGVSVKLYPEIQSYEEMVQLHISTIEKYCEMKKISPCDYEVKYYSCFSQNKVLQEAQELLEQITWVREDFFKLENQSKLLKLINNENWDKNCVEKKNTLQSIILTVNAANMSSLGPQERFQTEDLEAQLTQIFESIDCY